MKNIENQFFQRNSRFVWLSSLKKLFAIILGALSMHLNSTDRITENKSKIDVAIFVAFRYTQSDPHGYKRTAYAMDTSIVYTMYSVIQHTLYSTASYSIRENISEYDAIEKDE